MTQTTTQEFRVTMNTSTGKTVQITVPDADLNEVSSDTAVSIFNAAKTPLASNSDVTVVQSSNGGNVVGIKEAYVVNTVKTWVIEDLSSSQDSNSQD